MLFLRYSNRFILLWMYICFDFKVNLASGETYRTYRFESVCPSDGSKKKISLKSNPAIFFFDDDNPRMQQLIKERDFKCHIEIDTDIDGFHVYIEEMSLDDTPLSNGDCRDFLQFGRDFGFFTTRKSQLFCGERNKIHYGNNLNEAEHNKELAISYVQGNRFYVEEADNEMDIWLRIKKLDDTQKTLKRHLTLIITPIKKSCAVHDPTYRECHPKNRCVKRDLFCDARVNCDLLTSDAANDERFCDKFSSAALDHSSDSLNASNIPIIIVIMLVIVTIITVVYLTTLRLCLYCRKRQNETVFPAQQPVDTCASTPAFCNSFEPEDAASNPLLNRYPSAPPPSYDEAMKLPPLLPGEEAYTPSAPPVDRNLSFV